MEQNFPSDVFLAKDSLSGIAEVEKLISPLAEPGPNRKAVALQRRLLHEVPVGLALQRHQVRKPVRFWQPPFVRANDQPPEPRLVSGSFP